MSGKPSADMVEAMKLVAEEGLTPYAAAKRMNIALSTIYRSPLYKQWKSQNPTQQENEHGNPQAKP